MPFSNVNWVAVVVTTVVTFLIGWFWYSPSGFGKAWIKAMGWSPKDLKKKQENMDKSVMLKGFISTFVSMTILALVVGWSGASDAQSGALVGFWVWLGFSLTQSYGSILWEGKSSKLLSINGGYNLVTYAIAAAIIAVWV